MTDYKDTLNLPKTDFPMKANLPNREPEQLRYWQQIDLYNYVRQARRGKNSFFLHDGPPYANGQIHLGHAVNKVLKDIVTKSHLLDGYDSPYVPGWDCHGLPIEVMVEKKHGKAGAKVSHSEFRRLCREYAQSQIEQQKQDFLRLGILGNWNNPYKTMDYTIEANTIRSLGKIIENGYFRRGDKPVHWCLDCKSALAEAEVEYADKTSDAIDVAFTFEDQKKIKELLGLSTGFDIAIAIWTTTAWTIPSNRGLTLHPDFRYQLVRTHLGDKPVGLILAEELAEQCRQRWDKGDDWQVMVQGISGKAFEKMKARHPLYDRESLCVLGDFVTLETGTGVVHSSPAYGQEDFTVGQRYNLEVDNPVQDNGVFREDLPLFGGMHIHKANPVIVEQLDAQDALIHHQKFTHSYPHCWRHKTPTIQRATPQWFISMEQNQLGNKVLDTISKVQWIPSWGKDRMRAMIANRPDWCISRQRSWGTPITLLLHRETGEPHPRSVELIETIARTVEQKGIEGWFALSVEDLLPEDEARDYKKSEDTVDVWFDSGTTHHTVLETRDELHYPADIYLEGSDQHRGWFQSSLISAVAMNGTAPYKTVLTHGFTVDKHGRKMSKSLGNIIAPQEIVDKLGADVLRLWIASTDYSGEMTLSQDILQQSADTYRRIRNTIRFLLGNTSGFNPEQAQAADKTQLVAIDAWAINNCLKVQQQIIDNYARYNYARVIQLIYNFCAADLGAFYLDIIKDRLYTAKAEGSARGSAQTALWHILEALCRWIAPVLSFTAEETWRCLDKTHVQTVFAANWYQLPQVSCSISDDDWKMLQQIKDTVNKRLETHRAETGSGSALDLKVILQAGNNKHRVLKQIEDELRFLLLCSDTELQRLDHDDDFFDCQLVPCDDSKCVRCWQRRPEVGSIAQHPELCQRCCDNLQKGEIRKFV